MWCQLFSEPGAGSDLARLSTKAVRDGDEWIIDGQKVWTSGARHADYGYIICRTDPDVPKHVGLTAFIVPMHAPGVEVRPLRQMSGGASFNEVFFDGVRVGDDLRLGGVGDGWRVAMTTLGFERSSAGGGGGTGRWSQVLQLAQHLGLNDDPVIRQQLAALYTRLTVASWNNQRVAAGMRAGQTPGPEGSLGKLTYTEGLRAIGDVRPAAARRPAHRRHRRVGHVRLGRAPHRHARLPHRRRVRRGPAQHHRRARARPAAGSHASTAMPRGRS